MHWLPWAPLAAAALHIFEEFVYPGGFAAWYRHYRGDASRITPRFLIIINGALLGVCCYAGALVHTARGTACWLTIAAVMCSNGCWHALATYKSRSYSPGVVTGVMIYMPLTVYGYIQFLRSGATSVGTALMAGIVGSSYHLWSTLYHARRRQWG